MNAYHYSAAFDGCFFKFTTTRSYTHLLIVKEAADDWRALSWCGRLDLAEKQMRAWALRRPGREMKIIPVTIQ